VDKRFDEQRADFLSRFEQIDKRFDEQRADFLSRFDEQRAQGRRLFGVLTTILGILTLLVGYGTVLG